MALSFLFVLSAVRELRGAPFSDALDSPGLTWTTGGDLPWTISTNSFVYGTNAAFSGAVTNGQTSWIETTIPGPATVIFNYRRTEPQSLVILSNGQPAIATPFNIFAEEGDEWLRRFYQLRLAATSTVVRFQPAGTNTTPLSTRLDRVVVLPPGSAPQFIFENRSGPVLAETRRGISPYAYDNAGFGTNSVSYHFLKDGEPFPQWPDFGQFWPTNSGTYQVIASNSFGVTTSAPIVLTWVPNPPSIKDLCCSYTVTAGSLVVFYVDPGTSLEPLRGEWYRDGLLQPNAEGLRLRTTITNLSVPNYYSVILSNRYGTTVSSNLTVIAVPSLIHQQPTNQTVLYDSHASFQVGAYATESLTYQWRFNGTNLPGETESTLEVSRYHQPLGALSYYELLPSQSGAYSVVVSNIYGTVTSAVAQLTVEPGPRVTISSNQTPWPKFPATFTVSTTPYSNVSFQWRLNGHDIAGATNRSLTITNSTAADEGSYTCLVTGPYGSTLSPPATLSIPTPPPPTVYISYADTNVTIGGTAILFSQFNAPYPIPVVVQWSKDGSDLAGETNQFLVIHNAQAGDAGQYQVEVRTEYGTDSALADLTVSVDAPRISSNPTNATVDSGTPAVFSVSASGSRPMRYQWFHGVSPIPGATNSGIILHRTVADDSGPYHVVVSNLSGSVTSTVATLTLLDRPPVILSSSRTLDYFYSQGPVAVRSDVSGSWPMRFQWAKDGQIMPGMTNRFLEIQEATWRDGGTYTLTASNAFGIATSAQATYRRAYSGLQAPGPLRMSLPTALTNPVSFVERSNLVFVAAGQQGLLIFERNGLAPARTIGWLSTEGTVEEIALFGSVAALLEGGYSSFDPRRISVVDISDPSLPKRISEVPSGTAYSLVPLTGKILAAVARMPDQAGKLSIVTIDLGNPEHPKPLGLLSDQTLGGLRLKQVGDYVVSYNEGNWPYPSYPAVTDCRDPFSPRFSGALAAVIDRFFVSSTNGAALSGNNAVIIDLNDPAKPVVTARMQLESPELVTGIALNGSTALIARSGAPHTLISLTNPAAPAVIGAISNTASANWIQGSGSGFSLLGGSQWFSWVPLPQITQIALPWSPTNEPVTVVGSGGPTTQLVLEGHRAYVASGFDGLKVFDISNPYEPRQIGSWPDSTQSKGYNALNVAAFGSVAYVRDAEGQVDVVDFSKPTEPVRRGGLVLHDPYWNYSYAPGPFLRIGDMIATTASNRVALISVSNPDSPTIIRTTLPIYSTEPLLAGAGGVLYGDSASGFQPPKLTRINLPTDDQVSLTTFGTLDYAAPRTIVGKHLLASYGSSVRIYEIGVSNIIQVGQAFAGDSNIQGITAERDWGLVASDRGELISINLSEPTNPKVVGSVRIGTTPSSMAMRDGIAYISAVNHGLIIVRVDGIAPTVIGSSPRITTGGVELKVHSLPGTTNLIESSPDLVQWMPVDSILSTNRTTEVTVPLSGPSPRFFRTRRQ